MIPHKPHLQPSFLLYTVLLTTAAAWISASHASCLSKADALAMSEKHLYIAALSPNNVGGCKILRSISHGACALYVLANTMSAAGSSAWPRNRWGKGTGCVRAPDFPKRMGVCWYRSSEYNLPGGWTQFCTASGVTNAVNQVRHAIQHDQCHLPPCPSATPTQSPTASTTPIPTVSTTPTPTASTALTLMPTTSPTPTSSAFPRPTELENIWNLTMVIAEATADGWTCIHRKFKNRCFASTSGYIRGVNSSCSSCINALGTTTEEYNSPTLPVDSVRIKPPKKRRGCRSCPRFIKRNIPKCSAFLSGDAVSVAAIGCRIYMAGGCWPRSEVDPVFACEASDDCAVSVEPRKVRVYCCAPLEECAEGDAECEGRNAERCTTRAKKWSKRYGRAQAVFRSEV